MYLTSPTLSTIPAITHGFFPRKGGVSEGIYASLNCGLGSKDARANVVENRTRVACALGAAHLCSLYQVHSAEVVTVTKPWRHSKLPKADAMVTNVPGIALGILTADCVPVLFADSHANVIGAAHAGWKGAFAGVLQQTVKAMVELGAEASRITAAIGPSIAQNSYEVGEDFRKVFVQKSAESATYFIPANNDGHWLFNLKAFVRDSLSGEGLANINILENDTYLEEDAFFSFRRATHRGESDYGRQISAIMLK